jgi:hypothetical protein
MPTSSSSTVLRSGTTRLIRLEKDEAHSAAVDDGRRHCHRLNPELSGIAEEDAIGDAVQCVLGEDSGQQRADRAADAAVLATLSVEKGAVTRDTASTISSTATAVEKLLRRKMLTPRNSAKSTPMSRRAPRQQQEISGGNS